MRCWDRHARVAAGQGTNWGVVHVHDQILFSLVNPIVAFLFSATFGIIWFYQRRYLHLVTLALAFLFMGFGFVVYEFRLFIWPGEVNIPANAFYVATVTLACVSALQRRNVEVPAPLLTAIIVAGAIPFSWYLFIDPSTPARIFTTSAMFMAITATTFVNLVRQGERSLADKLFEAGVALAFFIALIRPSLVILGILDIQSPTGFAGSEYWTSIRAFSPLLSFVVALLFIVGIGLDTISHLKSQADRDYLTNLLNRRGFETKGNEALVRDFANSRQPAILLADIDDFKKVNDSFGHKVGDAVIVAVARVMARYGGALLAGRVGGEEFALYYNDVDRAQLQEAARVIKAALTEISVAGLPDDYPITMSIGLHMSYSQEALTDMMARADQALYRAKREGKDKAVITAVQLHLAVRNGVTG